MREATLEGGQRVLNTHDPALCAGGFCSVHNPSDHHMRDWPQRYVNPSWTRNGPGLTERVCIHGLGHPDPDHMTWYAAMHTPEETRDERTHICDGCCGA